MSQNQFNLRDSGRNSEALIMKEAFYFIVVGIILFFVFKKKTKNKKILLKMIPGEETENPFRNISTKVVGVTYKNLDGSSRQNAIKKLKPGQRLQLAWNQNDPYDSNAILVFGEGNLEHADMSTCIGHLKADLAADVVSWIRSNEYEGIYAEVYKIIGGDKDRPRVGCLIDLMLIKKDANISSPETEKEKTEEEKAIEADALSQKTEDGRYIID